MSWLIFKCKISGGGGVTKISFTSGGKIPNLQVGNKNVMIIGASGDVEKTKSKSKKSKENVKLTGTCLLYFLVLNIGSIVKLYDRTRLHSAIFVIINQCPSILYHYKSMSFDFAIK